MLAEFGVAVSGEAATQTSVVAHGIAVATDAPVLELWRALRAGNEPWRPSLVLPLSYALASAPIGTQVTQRT